LENGKLTQSGTHEKLIRQRGLYKRIWSIQSALEEELDSDGEHGRTSGEFIAKKKVDGNERI